MNLRPATFKAFGMAIRRRRTALGHTLDEIAAKTGISKPYLSNIETARAPGPPSEEKLELLARALGLPPRDLAAAADWLRTPASVRKAFGATAPRRADGTINLDRLVGDGALTPSAASREDQRTDGGGEAGVPLRMVPVINSVAAGKPAEYTDLDYPAGIAEEYVPAPDLPGAPAKSAFALRIVGESMAPEYAEGEMVIVGPGEAHDGDDCVVRLGRGANFATTFKRVFFVRDEGGVEQVRLVALNPRYEERVVAAEEVTGIYPLMYRLLPAKRGGSGA